MTKTNIWLKLLPKTTREDMEILGHSEASMRKKSMHIHSMTLLLVILAIVAAVQSQNVIYFGLVLILAMVLRTTQFKNFRQQVKYRNYVRHIDFMMFYIILLPHLTHANNTHSGLYRVLSKLETRLKDDRAGSIKLGINRLILGMTNRPGDIEPFYDFANYCSGAEIAQDIVVAVYDWQQNSSHEQALQRLKSKVQTELHRQTKELVTMKLDKFTWYSERIVMSVFVLILGIIGTNIATKALEIFKLIQ